MKCHLPGLQQIAPEAWKNFEQDKKDNTDPLWKSILLAPLKGAIWYVEEAKKQGIIEK